MKGVRIYILSIVLLASCDDNSRGKINFVFQPAYIPSTTVTSKSYFSTDGFCSKTICINSDSTFTWVQGCEDQSAISIGRWRVAGDSIELVPAARDAGNIQYRTYLSSSRMDSRVTIIIKDKIGKPVKNFIVLPFNATPAFILTDDGIVMSNRSDYKQSNFLDNFSTDSTGTIRLLKAETDSLAFSKLYALTGKKFRISTSNLPDTIVLSININGIAFRLHKLKYQYHKPSRFKYKNGTLLFSSN